MHLRILNSSLVACTLAATLAPRLNAQLMLGATAGAVHYDQQATRSSLALNPEVRYERRRLVFDASGGYTAGSDGGRVLDGGGTLWAATNPFSGHLQFDGLLQGSLTAPHADSSSSSLFGFGELAYAPEGRGVAAGIGAIQGTIQGSGTVSALRTEVRGWYVKDDLTLTASIEPTHLSGSWFVEYTAGADRSLGDWDVSGGLRLRQVSGAGVALGGTGSVSWDFNPRWTAELDLGRYLRDPYQGLPSGYFLSLGVRVKLASWKEGTGEGVGAASVGDVALHGAMKRRSVSQLSGSGRGTGNGHKP
jgi:hypothetical protein